MESGKGKIEIRIRRARRQGNKERERQGNKKFPSPVSLSPCLFALLPRSLFSDDFFETSLQGQAFMKLRILIGQIPQ
jgi:hypothetical protein